MIDALTSFGTLIVLLGTLVFIHEAGHFVVAKLLRIRVETFSLGFGPRLLGFRRGETDYRVSAIPLGGYVKMTGEMAGEEARAVDDPRAFSAKPRWARFLVMVAGASCNIVLAIAIWAGMFMHGVEVPITPEGPQVVAAVAAEGPAERAGILPGDAIVSVGGEQTGDLTALNRVIALNPGATLRFELERGGERLGVDVTLDTITKYHMGDAGLITRLPIQFSEIGEGSPAEAAGILAGDRPVRIEGESIESPTSFVTQIRESVDREIELTVEREGTLRTVLVTPRAGDDGAGIIGVGLAPAMELVKLGPAAALGEALRTTGEYADLLFYALRQLVSGAVSMRMMSGPIEIAGFSRQAAEQGPGAFLQLMALISLQLGIINLLPIPVLDGGNIMILLIEGVARRDLSQALKERVMQVGLVFLVLFMVTVIGFDILKSLSPSGV